MLSPHFSPFAPSLLSRLERPLLFSFKPTIHHSRNQPRSYFPSSLPYRLGPFFYAIPPLTADQLIPFFLHCLTFCYCLSTIPPPSFSRRDVIKGSGQATMRANCPGLASSDPPLPPTYSWLDVFPKAGEVHCPFCPLVMLYSFLISLPSHILRHKISLH